MQHNPAARLNVGREAQHIEQRPGMTMIGVDEGETELAWRRNLAGNIGFAAGVDAHSRDEVGNELGNLEADRARLVDAAMSVAVDGLDVYRAAIAMLVIDGGGNNCRGKSGQGSDLNNAADRKSVV